MNDLARVEGSERRDGAVVNVLHVARLAVEDACEDHRFEGGGFQPPPFRPAVAHKLLRFKSSLADSVARDWPVAF